LKEHKVIEGGTRPIEFEGWVYGAFLKNYSKKNQLSKSIEHILHT